MFIFSKNHEKSDNKSRKVLQIHPITCQVIKVWDSAKEAANVLNFDYSTIWRCCDNTSIKHAYGFIWRFENDFIDKNTGFIKSFKFNNNFYCNPLDLYMGYLGNYIKPCFILLPEEIFKNIEGYNGVYQISNLGRLISLQYAPYIFELKDTIGNHGYYYNTLYDKNHKGIKHLKHRLVAEAFIPNPLNLPIINHKNEIKTNNYVENLEWCDAKYNTTYGSKAEVIAALEKAVLQIDPVTNEIIREFKSMAEAERLFNFNHGQISIVCNGKRNTAYGFKWKFKE